MTTGAASDAREQLARLQAVTAALSEAATVDAIAHALVESLVALVQADATGVFRITDDGAALELLADRGISDHRQIEPHVRVGMDAKLPHVDAVRERRTVWLQDDASWAPYLQGLGPTDAPPGVVGVVPIVADGAPRGALFVYYGPGRTVDPADRELVTTIARQAAPALERARLLEVAELAAERTAQLQRVTDALARAATTEDVARAVAAEARTAVGAATALVYGARADGELELLAAEGFDDADGAIAATIPAGAASPAGDAARGGRAVVLASTADYRDAYPGSAAPGGGGAAAVLAVPMLLGDDVRGVAQFGYAQARRFAPEDVDLATTIADVAAQALDRSRLHAATLAARERAERLQETTAALAATLTREDVARVVTTEGLAALGAVSGGLMAVTEAGDELELLGIAGFTPDAVRRFRRIPLDGPFAFAEAVRERRTSVVPDLGPAFGRFPHLEDVAAGRSLAGAIVPLLLGERATGALAYGFASADDLDDETVTLLTTLAQLAAQALDRARLYEARHDVATRLQTSLLPDALPVLDDLDAAGRYLPGTAELDVGGDWYDVIVLPASRIALVAGDVVGRGLPAASAMGRLRSALVALAPASHGPADLLERLDDFARRGAGLPMATVAVAVIDPLSSKLTFACAGHPPPLLMAPGEEPQLLVGGRSAPLGAFPGLRRTEASAKMPPGSWLLLYTDGLVERRGESLDQGLGRLVASAGRYVEAAPDELCANVMLELLGPDDRHDDTALLAARTSVWPVAPLVHRLEASAPALGTLRRAARSWLAEAGIAGADAWDVVLALNEAATNAVEHSGATHVTVRLRARADGSVVVTIEDDGRWRPPQTGEQRGNGLPLMRALADTVELRPEHTGTVVTLRRGPR